MTAGRAGPASSSRDLARRTASTLAVPPAAGYGELNGAKPLTEPWHTR